MVAWVEQLLWKLVHPAMPRPLNLPIPIPIDPTTIA